MGRGRNVPVDQTQKKPKIRKDKERGEYYQWWRFDWPKEDKKANSVFLPDDVLNDLKLKRDPTPALQRKLNSKILTLKKTDAIDTQRYYRLRCSVNSKILNSKIVFCC